MLKNYFKIAVRNLRRRKGYTLINTAGLAIGMAACILIGLYVENELSYNDFHKKTDRIYRVLREFDLRDLHATITGTPSLLAPTLEKSVPSVKEAVRFLESSPVVKKGNQTFVEDDFYWADQGFFKIFSFPILKGEARLDRPGTVVLTQSIAAKYFQDENPIGQLLQVSEYTLQVTGIMADVPQNSTLDFDFVGSLATTDPAPAWGSNGWRTFILLAEGATKNEAALQINKVVKANVSEIYEQGRGFIPHLQPLTGIYFGQGVSLDVYSAGNIIYIFLFGALAIFILLLACINFINLATARSAERANEVGLRKTLGARYKQLTGQFLGETLLMSFLALGLALVLCRLAMPFFNYLAGKSLAFSTLFEGWHLLALLTLAVLTGLTAGFYPAIVLSKFKPVRILDSKSETNRGEKLRKALVAFQFALSIGLIASTIIVFQQLGFLRSKGLGFNQNNLVIIEQAGYLADRKKTFMNELEQLPGVRAVTSALTFPGSWSINSMWRPAGHGNERQNMNYKFVGWNFIETLDIKMTAGRGFSRIRSDSNTVILNEAAAHSFGWTAEEAIGKEIERGFEGEQTDFTVIGVAENYHYASLHTEIYPLILFPPIRKQNKIAARITSNNIPQTLDAMRGVWSKFSDLPFHYSFLAENLAAQYKSEQRLSKVFTLFTGLALLIACLGLFSLAAYAAERRTKEIGIRKVMGATVTNIVGLLSKDFLKLVLIGFVIAVPVAWYFMHQWLQDFAYRIDIGVGIFLLAGGLALLIALATVSWQSVRAGLANPVDSLRSE